MTPETDKDIGCLFALLFGASFSLAFLWLVVKVIKSAWGE